MLFMIIPSIADMALASVVSLGLVVMYFDLTSTKKHKTA